MRLDILSQTTPINMLTFHTRNFLSCELLSHQQYMFRILQLLCGMRLHIQDLPQYNILTHLNTQNRPPKRQSVDLKLLNHTFSRTEKRAYNNYEWWSK